MMFAFKCWRRFPARKARVQIKEEGATSHLALGTRRELSACIVVSVFQTEKLGECIFFSFSFFNSSKRLNHGSDRRGQDL